MEKISHPYLSANITIAPIISTVIPVSILVIPVIWFHYGGGAGHSWLFMYMFTHMTRSSKPSSTEKYYFVAAYFYYYIYLLLLLLLLLYSSLYYYGAN
jgi:hypothetical protein